MVFKGPVKTKKLLVNGTVPSLFSLVGTYFVYKFVSKQIKKHQKKTDFTYISEWSTN